jgi:RimJ/RimL family protein N-acetyltransferase
VINLKDKPMLKGDKVILRPFKAEDFTYIEECLKDAEVIKLTGSDSQYDREFTINWYNTRNEQIDRLDLAIVDRSKGILVGEVVVNLYDEKNQCMNFRILIGPRGRDRGLGTEATRLFINYIFSHTILKTLTLSVFVFNPRAKRVYEKVGFLVESIDENELEFEGEWIDSVNMKLTREDWLREKAERHGNFA